VEAVNELPYHHPSETDNLLLHDMNSEKTSLSFQNKDRANSLVVLLLSGHPSSFTSEYVNRSFNIGAVLL
jgi:hypothetical protein